MDIFSQLKCWLQGDRDIAQWQHLALQDSRLYHYLQWLSLMQYGQSCLQHDGKTFPVCVFPASGGQSNDPDALPDALIGAPLHEMPQVCREAGELYLQKLLQDSPGLWDGPTYAMHTLERRGQLSLTCSGGSYFDALISCDLLEFELLTAFGALCPQPQEYEAFTESLLLRSSIHQNGNPLRFACGRSAAIGVSTAVVYDNASEQRLLLRNCSPKIASRENLFHVIPSGMMQPPGGVRRDISVRQTIYTEYLEELWLVEELSAHDDAPERVQNHPRLRQLLDLEAGGEAELIFTGIAFDLLKLRPEICCLLIIRNQQWLEELRALNSANGFAELAESDWIALGGPSQRLNSLPLNEGVLPGGMLTAHNVAPAGAAAIKLALDRLPVSADLEIP